MTIAYSSVVFQGTEIKKMQVQKYVSSHKNPSKKYRRKITWRRGRKMESSG